MGRQGVKSRHAAAFQWSLRFTAGLSPEPVFAESNTDTSAPAIPGARLAESNRVKNPHPIKNAPTDSLNVIQRASTTEIGKPIFPINGANPIDEKDFPAWKEDQ